MESIIMSPRNIYTVIAKNLNLDIIHAKLKKPKGLIILYQFVINV